MNDYILIDPKGLISAERMDSVIRHSNYSRILSQREENSRLIVFGNKTNGFYNIEFLQSFGLFNRSMFRNLFSLRRIAIPKDVNPAVLIAGDPFLAYLLARKVQAKLKRDWCVSAPIQVQIHFDPKSLIFSGSLINKAKYLLTLFALKTTDSVRLVNALQLQYLPKFCTADLEIDVIPMKFMHPGQEEIIDYSRNRPRNIGFAGRLHRERGLETLLEILRKIPSESYSKVVIAGDGPEKQSFLQKLTDLIGEHKIIYLGKVEQSRMSEFWAMIGVLISCPESESYGLTVRESLINGVPVIATKSIGVSQLKLDFTGNGLYCVDKNFTRIGLKHQVETAFLQKISPSDLLLLRESDEKSIEKLIDSWIKLKSLRNRTEV